MKNYYYTHDVALADGTTVHFENTARGTRNGFAHDTEAVFFFPDAESRFSRMVAHCYYLNRTWKKYTFQTVMEKAVRQERADRELWLLYQFKGKNGYRRMTAGRWDAFREYRDRDLKIRRLNAVLKALDA